MTTPPPFPPHGAYQPPPFEPARWLGSAHLQTIVGRIVRPTPDLPVVRERWETPDGDFLDVDRLAVRTGQPDRHPLESAIPGGSGTDGPRTAHAAAPAHVLVLHGLEGSSERAYVRILMAHLYVRGIGCTALNFRGCSGEPNRLPRAYHFGETSDLAFAAARLRSDHPGVPLGAVGFSLGGNVLLKFLGEQGSSSPFRAAVAISVPFNLYAGVQALAAGWAGRVYTHYFLRSLKKKLEAKSGIVPGTLLRSGKATANLEEFDDAVTAPLHGFDGARDYYARSSSAGFLPSIHTPTLLLQALDDPFLPRRSVPLDVIAANPRLLLSAPERGGHLGFIEGRRRQPRTAPKPIRALGRFWAEREAARYLASALTDFWQVDAPWPSFLR